MGLLDNMWDDTVAGPRPDTGLSNLRKCSSSFSLSSASRSVHDVFLVTRSITILRDASSPSSPRSASAESGSIPFSPISVPDSPLTPSTTPRGDWKRPKKRSTTEAFEATEPRSPTVYDWVVISALDR